MRKIITLILIISLFLSVVYFCSDKAAAQTKVIKKTVKKVVAPEIAPAEPPKAEPTPEAVVEPPPPLPPPTFEVQLPEDKGLFGWGLNTDLGGKFLIGSLVLGVRGDIIFGDPLLLGEKIGLAEDAVEYKLGSGLVLSDKFKSIPLYADAVVYLKEGSLFGLDPFVSAGLILNLYGTGRVSGGLGGQINLGFLADFGFESRTQVALGYGTYKIGSDLSDSGIQLSIAQPLKL